MATLRETVSRHKIIFALVLLAAVLASAWMITMDANKSRIVLFETSMGNFQVRLYDDKPITSGNFEKLVRNGFYDNTVFHRVMKNFMIQGGDPQGTGYGGPGYAIPDEFGTSNSNVRGTISMANSGPNTGGSQFFINVVNNTYLDDKHPVFGEVISGMEIVDRISSVLTDYNDRPMTEVRLIRATMK